MSDWPPRDPSPTPRDPSPQAPSEPPRVETYQPPSPTEAPAVIPAPVEDAPPVDEIPPLDDRADDDRAEDDRADDDRADDEERDTGNDREDEGDETVFELNDLSMEQRRHLEMRLTGARLVHRWEVGSDLVINAEDEDAVEAFLDEVENPDAFELAEIDEFDDDGNDELVYKAMSDLYVAADRLQHNADDAPTAGSFHLAADGVKDLAPPFGFDPRLWAQVKELSASVVASLDADAEPDVVARDAKTLRQILANYV